ncbi:hypothetical protein BaRGS_00035889 [Batillaria attramentaria]|uniref:Uncharacterized protein n=1 Tax=Batillaria attramentaria TaxID=370345 RepID=A0ABD0JD99_9CAEN
MDQIKATDTVTTRLQHWSVTNPDTPAFIYAKPGGTRHVYTREQVYSLSRRAASWLRGKGVSRGDVVLCLVPSSPEQLFIVFGCSLLGAPVLVIPIILSDGRDIVVMMNLGNVNTIVLDAEDETSISILKKHIPGLAEGKVTSDVIPSLSNVVFCNKDAWNSRTSFLEALADENEAAKVDCKPDDVLVFLPTSGSTGVGKLVARTHREALVIGLQSAKAFGVEPGDVVYNPGSFGWVSGYPGHYLVLGITRLLPLKTPTEPPPEDPTKHLWDLLCQEKPTSGFLKGAEFEALLGRPDLINQKGAWRARVLGTGSHPIRKSVAEAIGRLTSELRVVYGSTEAGFNSFKSYREASQAKDFNCGKAFLGQEVKVVDSDLREVPTATKGQLLIRNDIIMSGYLKQPDETAKVKVDGGWLKPGDIASMDENGDVFVYGRESDIIMIRGLFLYPQLLEAEFSNLPGIAEVAIVATPDEQYVNRPCLCVVRDKNAKMAPLSAADILTRCADSFNKVLMAGSAELQGAVPKYCLFFEALPLNRNGKLQRKILREQVLQRLGITD